MSLNAFKHGVTASLNERDVDAWVDAITSRGALAPRESQEAVALAEAEVRVRAAQAYWRRAVAEVAKDFEDTENGQKFEAMMAQIRGLSDMTGEPLDGEGLRLLKVIERTADRSNNGRSRDLRLASRYLSEAFSARARRLNEWVECVSAFSRNEKISPRG